MKIRAALRSLPGRIIVLLFLLLLLGGSMLLSLRLGSLKLSLTQILETLWNQPKGIQYQILCNIRLPRILTAIILGGALSVSGFLLQTFFHNPIAGPFVLGISSGAKLVVAFVMIVFSSITVLWDIME